VDPREHGTSKRRRTTERVAACALDLFERYGYDGTTVAQVAEAAGVTEMTVYRHFPSKEKLLLDDPYDPVIASAVAGQDPTLSPLRRTALGLREAWERLPEPADETTRRRVRLVAQSDALRAAAWRSTQETERLIVEQLRRDGAGELEARVAASAVLAALMAALFVAAGRDDLALSTAVVDALDLVGPPDD
jgi:AcrR family transcriptional regulator